MAQTASASEVKGKFFWSLSLLATLFFMWGFITVLNDNLTPLLKAVFTMNYLQASLIQVSWFLGYLIFSIPSAKLVESIGYKTSIVVGLVTMAIGCLLFLPAADMPSYYVFLGALLIIAGGVALLQVAANPYVSVLGPEKSSSSRLNLVQSFNSFGTLLAVIAGAKLLLARSTSGTVKAGTVVTHAQLLQDAKTVDAPYVVIALILILIAVAFWLARLPKITTHPTTEAEKQDSVWRHPVFKLGVIAIFVYVGAEVAIGTFMINYISSPHVLGIPTAEASLRYLPYYWGGLWVGRTIGSQLMRIIHPSVILIVNSIAAIAAITVSVFSHGEVALWSILAIGLCESIMFPTIFTQAINGLGPLTGRGSGYLIMAICGGGVVPAIQGALADTLIKQHQDGLTFSFFTSAPCFLFVIYFAVKSFSHRPEAGAPVMAGH
jgi:FHS family L-fucose permease-like MFS transporter